MLASSGYQRPKMKTEDHEHRRMPLYHKITLLRGLMHYDCEALPRFLGPLLA